MVRLELRLDETFSDELDRLRDEWPDIKEGVELAMAQDLVGNLKRESPVGATGNLRQSHRVSESGDRMAAVAGGRYGVDYVLPVIDGSEPHPPGPKFPSRNRKLARWADRVPGAGFYPIWQSIFAMGTEANPYDERAIEATAGDVESTVIGVLEGRGVL